MSLLFEQQILGVHPYLIVDGFAGGGGASSGIEEATGRQVDIAYWTGFNGGGWVTNLIGVPKWWCYLPEQPKEGGNG